MYLTLLYYYKTLSLYPSFISALLFFRTEVTLEDCSVCKDCPKQDPNPLTAALSALFSGGSCKQRCDLCGFCGDTASNLFGGLGGLGNLGNFGNFGNFGGNGGSGGNLDQCRFCKPGPNDPSGSKACTEDCEKGEPICKGPCQTQCKDQ